MKKFPKLISLFLIPALLLGVWPVPFGGVHAVLAEETAELPVFGNCGDQIRWEITEDTEADWDLAQGTPYKLTLTGTGEMRFGNDQNPWERYKPTITSISIQDGITNLPDGAFNGCVSLKTLTLPDSVTVIGTNAAACCSLLETVVCGTGLKRIEEQAFYNNPSLTNVQIQEGLEVIGRAAFSRNKKLQNLVIPDSVTTLETDCLTGTALTSFTVPRETAVIGKSFMQGNKSLQSIQVAEGNTHFRAECNVLYELRENVPYRVLLYAVAASSRTVNIAEGTEEIAEWSFAYANHITSLTLPETLRVIEDSAFYWSERISSLHIPDGVESIGIQAFAGCGLTTLTVGKGLQSMSGEIFQSCSHIESVTVSKENPYLEDIDNVVYNKDHTVLYYYAPKKPDTEYHVIDMVERMGSYCMMECQFLKDLYLPKNLASLGSGALTWNYVLNSIYVQGNAPSLEFMSINSMVENLLIYKIPGTTGWDASEWESYEFATWNPENTIQMEGSFEGVSWNYQGDNGKISFTGTGKIPDFTEEHPAPWSAYMESIQTIEADGVTDFGNYAFYGGEKLLRFEAKGLKRIGDYAFADCGKLLYIDAGETETIGTGAFQNDSAIQGDLVLKEIVSMGSKAFQGCASLTSVLLSSRIQTLEEQVFSGCTSMADVIVPDSITVIKAGAFQDSGLRTVNIPAKVHTIEAQAFQGNAALEKVYFYGGIPENWEEDSFQDCGSLTFCYRTAQTEWESFQGSWNGIPLLGLDKFYTERKDHYSFGNNASSFGYPVNYRISRQRYVDIMNSIVSGTYFYAVSGIWQGSCYGMAGTTLEFYENPEFRAEDYQASAENLFAVAAPRRKDADLTKLIEAYQISQNKGEIAGCGGILSTNTEKYLEIIQKVEAFERSGGLRVDAKAEPILLALYSRYGAHAVIPVSVDQAENGEFLIKVYDPSEPASMQTLKIDKDFKGISYKFYTYASYLDYSVINSVMSGIELHHQAEEETLYLSVDQEDRMVENKEGKGIDEIEGAYEQKQFRAQEEDTFSGIRSFVLPKGSYQMAPGDSEASTDQEEGVTFYLASQENFAEITSSDEDAILEVNEKGATEDELELILKSESAEEENTILTLVNEEGMERILELEGGNAAVTVGGDDMITVQVPEQKKVTIDGQEAEVKNGQVLVAFAASEEEDSLKTRDSEISVTCDAKNRLNGTINLAVLSGDREDKNVTITASFLEKDGKKAASYSKETVLKPGRNYLTLPLKAVETSFTEKEGDVKLSCEIEIREEEGEPLVFQEGELAVSLTKQEGSGSEDPEPDPEPEKPDPGPEDPKPSDPEDPEEPEQPGPEDPGQPEPGPEDPGQPEQPGPEGPGQPEPGPEDPEEPEQPGPEDPGQPEPGPEGPEEPGQPEPGPEDPDPGQPNPGPGEPEDSEQPAPGPEQPDPSPEKPEPGPDDTAEIPVSQINIKTKAVTLGVGETFLINASVLPQNAANKKLEFQAMNDRVEVSQEGNITAVKPGTSYVLVRSSSQKREIVTVTVKKAPEGVLLNVKEKTLHPGESFKIEWNLPKDTASHKITYASSDESVASVSSEGIVTARKNGTAVITVGTFNGKKAEVKIRVQTDIAVEQVKIPVKKLILGVGESCKVNASVLPRNASNKKLSYTISNRKVKVTSAGKIQARKTGTCIITIRAGNGKSAKVIVKVKKAPKKITLNASKKILKAGRRFRIKAFLPSNTASRKITYASNKPSVASVSSKGMVTAKKKGKAVITVKTFNKKKAVLKITVK